MAPQVSSIGGIASIGPITPAAGAAARPVTAAESSFGELMAQAVDSMQSLQAESDTAAVDFVSGGDTELHDVMIAMEKANLGMQLTLQVRNKVVEAYQEIMRMQV